jgi:histidine phosphotransferase ChpT
MTQSPDTRLARTLCARLCHDLGGAVGSLTGALDLVEPGEDELLTIAQETGVALRQRLRLYAAAWGGPTTEHDAAGLAAMLGGSPASPRVSFDLGGLAPGAMVPAPIVPIALNAALLAAEALPRGGTVSLSGSAEGGLVVLPQGTGAAWPPPLLALLSGTPLQQLLAGGPRSVLAPFLLSLLGEAGWHASLGFAGEGGLVPLLLGPG